MTNYDLFVERSADPRDIAAMDLDTIAAQVAGLMDDNGRHDYPRDLHGQIDFQAIAHDIRNEAKRLVEQGGN